MRRRRLYAGVLAVCVAAAVIIVSACGYREPTTTQIEPSSDSDIAQTSTSGRIAFHSDRDGDSEIYVMNADGSNIQQLTRNDSGDCCASWSPDGNRIAFSSDRGNDVQNDNLYVMNADGSDVQQLTDSNHSDLWQTWSPAGDRIAFSSGREIYVVNDNGSDPQNLTNNDHPEGLPIIMSDHDGERKPYFRKPDGSLELVTDWTIFKDLSLQSIDVSPSWSPDGSRIAFMSHRDGDAEIHVMNADGSNVEQLTHNDYDDYSPAWSPDGSRIAFASGTQFAFGGDGEIYVMNTDGSNVQRLTHNDDDDAPAWSPDGRRIAFTSVRDEQKTGIYVMNADGSDVKRLTDGYSPAWSY